jgi:hypothetical protein
LPTFSKGEPNLVDVAAESSLRQLAPRLHSREARGMAPRRREVLMGKYVLAWLLGVPASVLAVIYIVSNAGCS